MKPLVKLSVLHLLVRSRRNRLNDHFVNHDHQVTRVRVRYDFDVCGVQAVEVHDIATGLKLDRNQYRGVKAEGTPIGNRHPSCNNETVRSTSERLGPAATLNRRFTVRASRDQTPNSTPSSGPLLSKELA